MSQTDNNTKYTLKGERAAIGGYLAQYDAFAISIYNAIKDGILEEIRVADIEENVGKLDDMVYVTKDSVHAYQIKWSNIGAEMAYPEFKKLIAEVVKGWRNLKRLYPDKTIYPYLLTNKSLTDGDITIKSLAGKRTAGFKEYEQEVLLKLKKGDQPNHNWDNAIAELKTISTLTIEEWGEFWKVFDLIHDYKKETIEVAKIDEDQRIFDIICINRFIQEIVGSKNSLTRLTVREIIACLNWEKRFDTIFDHNLSVPEDLYVPNVQGMELLNAAIKGKTKGYVFLKGTPGSGKSTLLTQWARTIRNPSIRFYAFDFLNPSSQKNNDSSRGSGQIFLHDIILQIHKTGVEGCKTILPNMDYDALRERFYSQLGTISTKYKQTGIPFVIIVDGLDHITREYTDCLQKLMEVLPSPMDIPDGVIFVLGSQHYDHLGLNHFIEKESQIIGNLVDMPPMCKEETVYLCRKLLSSTQITDEILEKCWKKTQGHPLFLRYLLNHLAVAGTKTIEMMDDAPEEVEDYYARIVGCRLDKFAIRDALGLVARIAGNILLDDVRALCTGDALLDIKNQMWHLFIYDEGGQFISFFHNSFRQYLLNKTAEDLLTGKYSKSNNLDYYRRLAEHFKDGWDKGYYLYSAEEYDQFLAQMTPENLFEQIQNYRPIWSVRRDLERGGIIAQKRKDPYLLVRYLLFENQISQMDNQEHSVISLTEEFIHTGRSALAKAVVRDGRQLHCSQLYAMTLAVDYLKFGDKDEANLLFTLSYPEFLLHKTEEHQNHYQDIHDKEKLLTEWVRTAGYFLDWTNIKKHIPIFMHYLETLAMHNRQGFDEDEFRSALVLAYLESLSAQDRWPDFETVAMPLATDDKYKPVIFQAFNNAIKQISNYDGKEVLLSRYFVEVKKLYADMNQQGIIQLIMADLAQRSGQTTEIITEFLNKTKWEEIGAYYQSEVSQKFETLKPFIFFVKTRARYGLQDDILTLVPDDSSHKDNDLMVNYVRRVLCIAQMAGNAQAGIIDSSFISLVTHSIRYFDVLEPPMSNHNMFAYTILQQRNDFYEFVIQMAKNFGINMVDRVAKEFERYFSESSCCADGTSQRQVIISLFRIGYNSNWCKTQLKKVDTRIMTSKDSYGRITEALMQGRAWLEMGNYNAAEEYFHRMIEETFGIGYRKDYQPTLFAEWIGDAIFFEPNKIVEYVHWLTSRLKYINEIAETKTSYRAAHKLLCKTLEYNLRSGFKLAVWLLDEEYEYYQSVSSILLQAMLKKANTKEEYMSLVNSFTDLHLYFDENDAYDLSTSLLRAIVTNGQRILGDRFIATLSNLRQKIRTECPENIVEGLLKRLDDLLNPNEAKGKDYQHTRDVLLTKAKLLRKEGRKDEAWSFAINALSDSTSSGWTRYYDGGSRLEICKELQKIDAVRGREFTLDLFASDIPNGYSYGTSQYLNEILPLLTEQVDRKRLFEEEFAYMNRILRNDTINDMDKPDINPDDSTVCEILRDWLLFLANMPVVCLSERAKMQLAKLHDTTGTSILCVLSNNVQDTRLKLEIGCYLAELGSSHIIAFKETALKNAVSPNYQYRLYATIILHAIGEPIPQAPHKTLSITYYFKFPEKAKEPHNLLLNDKCESTVDWEDVSSVMKVASHWSMYLAYCTGIEQRAIEYRAVKLMKKYGDVGKVNEEHDRVIANHYDHISLRCPYRKAHAQAAINGMMEVVAEMKDGNAVNGNYYDGLFISHDFTNIHIDATPKPKFIQRLTPYEEWNVKETWVEDSDKSSRLQDKLPEYGEGVVIGEYCHLRKMSDNPPMEEYEAKISFSLNRISNCNSSIFEECMFMQTTDYSKMIKYNSEIILHRSGYYIDFANKSCWIAINPALAISLGWRLEEEGCFAWSNSEGKRMVESVYWQSGNFNMSTRKNYETGEGWMVVASKEAVVDIRKVAMVYVHKRVVRRRENDPIDNSHQAYKVEKME